MSRTLTATLWLAGSMTECKTRSLRSSSKSVVSASRTSWSLISGQLNKSIPQKCVGFLDWRGVGRNGSGTEFLDSIPRRQLMTFSIYLAPFC